MRAKVSGVDPFGQFSQAFLAVAADYLAFCVCFSHWRKSLKETGGRNWRTVELIYTPLMKQSENQRKKKKVRHF